MFKIAEELVPYKVEEVDRHYKEYLKKQGRVGDLIDVDVLSAIDVLVEQGNWDRALATAVQQNVRNLCLNFAKIMLI